MTNHKGALTKALELLREARETIDSLPGYPKGADLCDRIDAALSAIPADVSTQSTCQADVSKNGGNVDISAERSLFEKACADHGFDYDRVDALSPLAWEAWQWRSALTAPQDAQELDRCGSCNDTGDLIDLTGEWRGYCVCDAGQALKGVAAQPSDNPEGCCRSHPHENMSEECRRKTEEARHVNAEARKPEGKAEQAVRNEALEDAAKVCDQWPSGRFFADAIRSLQSTEQKV